MDHEDEVPDTEQDQCYYLDGTPANSPEDPQVLRPGFIEQTVTDVTKFLMAPLGWFRKKPTRTLPQQSRRNVEQKSRTNFPPPARPIVLSNGRPTKRHRSGSSYDGNTREMPPNVVFVDDERPRAPSSDSYLTEDEDDDMESSGPSTSSGCLNGRNLATTTSERSNPVSSNPTSNTITRRPLTERMDFSNELSEITPVKPSLPIADPVRRNTLLPLISTAHKRPSVQHPLMMNTKVTVPAITTHQSASLSRKRTFDAVDQDDTGSPNQSKLFSTFPKSSEKLPVPLSRFNSIGKSLDTPSASKLAAPYYATKRYESLLGQNKDSAPKKTSTFQPMKPLVVKPYMPVPRFSQIPSLPTRPASTKLEYRFVVPTVKTASVSGLQEFRFQSSVTVPNGAVKVSLDRFILSQNDRDGSESTTTSRQSSRSPTIRRCGQCGLIMGNEPGERCDVCVRVKPKTIGSGNTSVDANQKKNSSFGQSIVFDVDDETWNCAVCDTENARNMDTCKDCGKSRKSGDSTVKKAPLAKPTTSKQDSVFSSQRKESGNSIDSEPPTKKSPNIFGEKSKESAPASNSPASSTETAKSAESAPPPAGFIDIWNTAAKPKTWSCPGCFCSNAETMEKCPACETLKPGSTAKITASTATTTPPSSLFGGIQPALTSSKVDNAAPSVNGGTSSGGFNFGIPTSAVSAIPSKTGDAAKPPFEFTFGQAASSTGETMKPAPSFTFGQTTPALPVSTGDSVKPAPTFMFGQSTSAQPPSFTGFSGLAKIDGANTTTTTMPQSIFPSTTTTAPSFNPMTATTSASSTGGFSFFGSGSTAPVTTTAAPATAPFGGFASNNIPTSSAPTAPTQALNFTSSIPTFGSTAQAGTDFSFGRPPAAQPSFSFNLGGGPSPVFGQQNGLTAQTTPAPAPTLFGGATFGSFGQPAPVQNGQTGFAPSGLPQPGTFGGSLIGAPGTMGTLGTIGSPRRILKGKRYLGRN